MTTILDRTPLVPLLLSSALVVGACADRRPADPPPPRAAASEGGEHAGRDETHFHDADHGEHAHVAAAVADMRPTQGSSVEGTVRFVPEGHGVRVVVALRGLEPGSTHAMHVHEHGDCSAPDASSAGSHYNPGGHPHGLPESAPRHAGDMGNVTADGEGVVDVERTFDNFSIDHAHLAPVLGRSVIVHVGVDDGSQPVGNAGARLACGVIQPAE